MIIKKAVPKKAIPDIELVPDAWPRFEKFIREIAKAGPQHRKPIEKPKAKSDAKASQPLGKRKAKASTKERPASKRQQKPSQSKDDR